MDLLFLQSEIVRSLGPEFLKDPRSVGGDLVECGWTQQGSQVPRGSHLLREPPPAAWFSDFCNMLLHTFPCTESSNSTDRQSATQMGGIKRKAISLLFTHQYKLYIHGNINHSRKCLKISRQHHNWPRNINQLDPSPRQFFTSCFAKCCSATPCFRLSLLLLSRLPGK